MRTKEEQTINALIEGYNESELDAIERRSRNYDEIDLLLIRKSKHRVAIEIKCDTKEDRDMLAEYAELRSSGRLLYIRKLERSIIACRAGKDELGLCEIIENNRNLGQYE